MDPVRNTENRGPHDPLDRALAQINGSYRDNEGGNVQSAPVIRPKRLWNFRRTSDLDFSGRYVFVSNNDTIISNNQQSSIAPANDQHANPSLPFSIDLAKVVVVSNLPLNETYFERQQTLKSLFGPLGHVEWVSRDPQRPDVAAVEFRNTIATVYALALNGSSYGGNIIHVRRAEPRDTSFLGVKLTGRNKKVRVPGLSSNITEEAVRAHFGAVGDVDDVQIVRSKRNQREVNCFVRFTTFTAGRRAIAELDGTRLDGCRVVVEEDASERWYLSDAQDIIQMEEQAVADQADDMHSTAQSDEPPPFDIDLDKVVILSNLPFEQSQQMAVAKLKRFLRSAGPMGFVGFIRGKHGVATTEFLRTSGARNALGMNGTLYHGNIIHIRAANTTDLPFIGVKIPERNTQIMVHGLPQNITEHVLKSHFNTVGDVAYVYIPPARNRQLSSRWYASVNFARPVDARRAIAKLNNTMVQGHRVEVQLSTTQRWRL